MKKIILFANLVFCINISFAQTDNATKYAATITGNDLKKHLTIIAGEEMEGRETGTEGQRKAAAYIENQFKSIGLLQAPALKNYQQFYPLFKDSISLSSLHINGKDLVYGIDYIAPIIYNGSAILKAKKIVFAGYGISDKNYDDYAGKNVKGKVVVFFTGEPKQGENYIVTGTKTNSMWSYSGLSEKLNLAKQKGALVALVINPTVDTFINTSAETSKKRNIYYPREEAEAANYILLSHAIAKSILGENNFNVLLKKVLATEALTAKSKEQKVKFTFNYKKDREQINASNIIGIIEGSDKKDEYVFLTAHYDHLGKHNGNIYYGADDDGSGTCAVIEMAEAFKKAKAEGNGPRRTVVCMTVSGEEKGLWGSEYYSDHPVFPLNKTTVDLNTDMVGRIDTERKTTDTLNYVYVVGHDKISTDLPVINEGVNNKYTQLQLDYKFDDPKDPQRIYYRSDHYNFAIKGVPVLFFYDGMLQADYHKPTDTVDKINWNLYEKRVRMIFHTAWEMANKNELLKRDIPLPKGRR
jgi:Zn-dependent M28 family amino/carboxypeptidase